MGVIKESTYDGTFLATKIGIDSLVLLAVGTPVLIYQPGYMNYPIYFQQCAFQI